MPPLLSSRLRPALSPPRGLGPASTAPALPPARARQPCRSEQGGLAGLAVAGGLGGLAGRGSPESLGTLAGLEALGRRPPREAGRAPRHPRCSTPERVYRPPPAAGPLRHCCEIRLRP